MKQTLIGVVLLVLALLTPVSAVAQTPVANGLDSFGWDYTDADLSAAAVVRFEVCLDAVTPCASVTPASSKQTAPVPEPPAGSSTYAWKLPAMLPGQHSVSVKACNADDCSAATALTFRFSVVPNPPRNGRLIKGS